MQTVQIYQAQFQTPDLQKGLTLLDNNQSAIHKVLTTLQAYGMSPYLINLANEAGQIGAYLNAGGYNTSVNQRMGATPMSRPPIQTDPGNDGGGYSCAADGALIVSAGLAFAVLTVMSGGAFGIAPVLAGAAWGGIATWGGLGVTAWGLGHITVGHCDF